MIREYALEPDLLSSWDNFRYFTEKFSVPQGRLISRFPERWKALVYEACGDCRPVEKKRIEEALQRINDRLLRTVRSYDAKQPWLDNAVASHAGKPFHAVIAQAGRRSHDYIIAGDDADDSHPLLTEKRSDTVARQPAPMAEVAGPLLAMSRVIVFVDPYFRPVNLNFRLPLKKFLEKVVRRRGAPPSRIEYHTGNGTNYNKPDGIGFDEFKQDCENCLPECIPQGTELRIVRWQQGCIHNRYILTDKGVLEFGTGLDKATSTKAQTDTVTLLDEAVRSRLWREYVERTGSLVPAGDPAEIVVAGSRIL
jgi:hypothetical protein